MVTTTRETASQVSHKYAPGGLTSARVLRFRNQGVHSHALPMTWSHPEEAPPDDIESEIAHRATHRDCLLAVSTNPRPVIGGIFFFAECAKRRALRLWRTVIMWLFLNFK